MVTEELLACGFLERIHELLPGIREERVETSQSCRPSLETPVDVEKTYFIHRDREEELWAIARRLKKNRPTDVTQGTVADGAVGVVFQRPLPYLYLAEQIFGGSKISFEIFSVERAPSIYLINARMLTNHRRGMICLLYTSAAADE